MIGEIVSVKDEEIDFANLRVMLPYSVQNPTHNDIFHRHQRSLRYSSKSGLADRGEKKVIFQLWQHKVFGQIPEQMTNIIVMILTLILFLGMMMGLGKRIISDRGKSFKSKFTIHGQFKYI